MHMKSSCGFLTTKSLPLRALRALRGKTLLPQTTLQRVTLLTWCVLCASGVNSSADMEVPALQWDVDLRRPSTYTLPLYRGETIALQPRFLKAAGTPFVIPESAIVELRYRPTGAYTGTYYQLYGSVESSTNGRVTATWTAANEATNSTYSYTYSVTADGIPVLRCNGTLTLTDTVGGTATNIPPEVGQYITRSEWIATNSVVFADIDGFESDILAMQGEVSTNTALVAALNGRVGTNEIDILALDGRVTTNAADISSLDGRVITNETDISALDGRVTTNDAAISVITTGKLDIAGGTITGDLTVDGTTTGTFVGDGSGLTGLIAAVTSGVNTVTAQYGITNSGTASDPVFELDEPTSNTLSQFGSALLSDGSRASTNQILYNPHLFWGDWDVEESGGEVVWQYLDSPIVCVRSNSIWFGTGLFLTNAVWRGGTNSLPDLMAYLGSLAAMDPGDLTTNELSGIDWDILGGSTVQGGGSLTIIADGQTNAAVSNLYLLNATPHASGTGSLTLQGVPPVGNTNAWSVLQAQVLGDVTNLYWSPVVGPQGLPGGAYTNTTVLVCTADPTNRAQTFTVPAGVSNLYVKAWGAGGGSYGGNYVGAGGAGGFTASSIAVEPLEVLTVVVGQGGGRAAPYYVSYGGWPGGGNGWGHGQGFAHGGGGGYSGVFRGTNVLMIAAGGGGGAYGGTGGTGGASVGATASGSGSYRGTGGTQTEGGNTNGAFLSGGSVAVNLSTSRAGGGGGGGYFGGGAMYGTENSTTGGGGGGSSYYVPGYGYYERGVNSADEHYVSGVGVGGSSSEGGDGMVIIFYP